ncbi:MAG: phosphoesterase PA-phosphatase [Firmicutes bacterium]|nr:phosphoesterase PA-phosphatase [Bacillota bacterium]
MNKGKGEFILPDILIVAFIIFTLGVSSFDVQAIGPNGTTIGFGTLNAKVMGLLSYNHAFYMASEILGYLGLLLAAAFGCLGLYQLIKRKSLLKVDRAILVLGVFFVLVLLFYVLFNSFIVNYRPIIMDGELEPGYPSSHTMLAICVFYMSGAALMEITNSPQLAASIRKALYALMALTVVCRFLSGVHWATDIIGAVLLSAAICSMYNAVLDHMKALQESMDKQERRKAGN